MTGSQQQLAIFEKTDSRREVVRQMLTDNDWQAEPGSTA